MHSLPFRAGAVVLLLFCLTGDMVRGSEYAARIAKDRPVAYFRFEQPTTKTIVDSARTSNQRVIESRGLSTVRSSPFVVKKKSAKNRAASFAGKSYLLVTAKPDDLDFSGPMSIEFWIRPTNGGEATQCFIAKGVYKKTNTNYYVVYFQNQSGKSGRLRFGIADGHIDQVSTLKEDVHTHVAVTYFPAAAGSNAKIYINGRLDAEKHIPGKPRVTKGTPLSIGALYYDPPKQPRIQYFVGGLDELAFYKQALTHFQVAAHFSASTPSIVFEADVRPIFKRACLECHSDKPDGKLDLRTVTSILRGGANGPAIVRGKASRSILTERTEFGEMPPADSGHKLSSNERQLIKLWIDSGAKARERVVVHGAGFSLIKPGDRQHWAFRQFEPQATNAKTVQRRSLLRAPVDAFVQARLEQHGLSMSPEADRMRLIRRLYIDLIGLPPTPQRVKQFVSDTRPNAYEQLVDELLASPHFGIRWGRRWLDIAGYTDTISFDDDYGPPIGFVNGKWRYRDYVIRSLNRDKPYGRFLTEQLAGDELVEWRKAKTFTPKIIDSLVATGFLRCCEDISKEDPRPFIIWSVLHDSVEQIGTSLLGLTLNCSRCHTHKFEPIPQRDYYGLMATLTPALNPSSWKNPQQRAVPNVSATTVVAMNKRNAEITRRVNQLRAKIATIRKRTSNQLRVKKVSSLPKADRAIVSRALKTPVAKQDAKSKALLKRYAAKLKVSGKEIDSALPTADRKQTKVVQQEIDKQNAQRQSHGWIHAVYDVGQPPATRLFRRGSYLKPRREVAPGFLSVLMDGDFASHLKRIRPASGGSGRRLALARWMTDKSSPASALVFRVMANRVWSHLMGEPIVGTVDNLGVSGSKPTHPRLLEWLASDFRRHGSIKRLIRQIVTSAAYRQASFGERKAMAQGRRVDPKNRLLWRARLRRVEAEVIRDSILSVAKKLDTSMGGPPVPLQYLPNGTVKVATKGLSTPSAQFRRSVYLLNRRIYNPSFLSVFDKPIVTGSMCRRDSSAVALQSLSMMNDAFVVDRAAELAGRIVAAAGPSINDRIDLLFRVTVSRNPTPQELGLCRKMLAVQQELHRKKNKGKTVELAALADLCQTVLNMNEFLYLE